MAAFLELEKKMDAILENPGDIGKRFNLSQLDVFKLGLSEGLVYIITNKKPEQTGNYGYLSFEFSQGIREKALRILKKKIQI